MRKREKVDRQPQKHNASGTTFCGRRHINKQGEGIFWAENQKADVNILNISLFFNTFFFNTDTNDHNKIKFGVCEVHDFIQWF